MKKNLLAVAFTLLAFSLSAQQLAKKYIFIEHFTNSWCSICASRNPAFYNTISQYAADIHHVAVHPSVPYPQCVFYQANTTENNNRANLYGIQGTPRIALNGTLLAAGNPLLPVATLQAQLNQTSPLYVKVEESDFNGNRVAKVTLRTLGAIPSGTYKLFLAVAEKTINYTSPNGEAVHHDVFRKMIPSIDGVTITLPAIGEETIIEFPFPLNTAWDPSQVFVTAFVQNTLTKEVLNSGTKFDPVLTDTDQPETSALHLAPNPATDHVAISLDQDQIRQIDCFDVQGRLVRTQAGAQGAEAFELGGLPTGIYLLRVTGESKAYIGKLIKE